MVAAAIILPRVATWQGVVQRPGAADRPAKKRSRVRLRQPVDFIQLSKSRSAADG